jgi:hypothetical protein
MNRRALPNSSNGSISTAWPAPRCPRDDRMTVHRRDLDFLAEPFSKDMDANR